MSRLRRPLALVAVFLGAAGLAGCESTQDQSARLEADGGDLVKVQKVDLGAKNRQIEVRDKVLISDQNGSAVVVLMSNRSKEGLAEAPIGIDVKDKSGKSLYRNDLAGLESALTEVPVMRPQSELFWVNDQVLVNGEPRSVDVKVGEAARRLPADLPEIEVSKPRLAQDPTSGIEATGTVTNRSDVEQVDLVLYALARKGGRIVAAGRAQIPRLKTDGKPETFHIFFIGNPSGADISVVAPPVNLE